MNSKVLTGIVAVLLIAVAVLGFVVLTDKGNGTSTTQQSETTENQTQGFNTYSANEVVAAIENAELPIQDVEENEIGGTAAPATEIESKSFVIPSVAPNGGQILIFADEQGLNSKKAWFDNYPDLAPYVYVKGNAMIQLNSGLPATEAAKYKTALERM